MPVEERPVDRPAVLAVAAEHRGVLLGDRAVVAVSKIVERAAVLVVDLVVFLHQLERLVAGVELLADLAAQLRVLARQEAHAVAVVVRRDRVFVRVD